MKIEGITFDEWETFFDVMEKITDAKMSDNDIKNALLAQADEYAAVTVLMDFFELLFEKHDDE